MEECQFLAVTDPQADRVHDAGAKAAPVTYGHIHMEAAEAVGTVISLVRTWGFSRHSGAALCANEGLTTLIQRK